jgi:hypothetical protein
MIDRMGAKFYSSKNGSWRHDDPLGELKDMTPQVGRYPNMEF